MASRASVEDIEAGAEYERIRQNFQSTVVAPDVSANLPETQTAFQELQSELQDFLRDHLNKVRDLQGFLSANQGVTDSNGAAHNSHGTVTSKADRRTISLHPADGESLDDDAASTHTVSNAEIKRSRSVGAEKVPVDAHLQALHSFLNAHTENIKTLQNSLQGTGVARSNAHVPPAPHYKSLLAEAPDPKHFEDFNRQFNMLVVISTFTATLIVGFLSLVRSIIGTTHKTAYNVGMFFAFMALLIHFGNITIAGRGAAVASQQEKKYDYQYFKVYLTLCEQLQFLALISFVVSVAIMAFLIFISVAFPIVLLLISLLGILVVFSSAYWEVSLTLRNLQYLAKNIQRLKQSLEYLRISGRMGRD